MIQPRQTKPRSALLDCREQLRHIDCHRRRLSRALGREVHAEQAAVDWILKYAAKWREWRECGTRAPFGEFPPR